MNPPNSFACVVSSFFYNFFHNIGTVFSFRNLKWHVLAIALTYVSVVSGFDWFYFEHSRTETVFALSFPAALLGFVVPVLLPLALLIAGLLRKNARVQNAAYALGQSALLGWIISSAYKAATGRAHPEFFSVGAQTLTNITHAFSFGLSRSGIFWGWPSSHTTVAFALAATAITLYPSRSMKIWAGLFALYIGVGVSLTIHWFSDFVAGAIFGTLIGIVVGRAYKARASSLAKS